MTSREWLEAAACRRPGMDAEWWFPPSGMAQATCEGMRICQEECPVREACLADALKAEEGFGERARFGIFGGLTPDQRGELDATPRRRGGPTQASPCPWPGEARAVERHARRREDPCWMCRDLVRRRASAERQSA